MPKRKVVETIQNLSKRSLLRIYLGIAVLLLLLTLENVFRLFFSAHTVLGALMLGIILGVLVARIDKLTWNEDLMEVVRFVDYVGVVVSLLFIIFVLFRLQIILWYLPSAPIASLVIPVFTGFMGGRLFGDGDQAIKTLRKEGVFKS